MWTVPCNGTEIDIDPLTFDMALWDDIEQRAGISGLPQMLNALFNFQPNAWRVLYWAGTRRAGDQTTFADFRGPSYADVLANRARLAEFGEEVAALMGVRTDPKDSETPASNG